jgi:hypothetical protein
MGLLARLLGRGSRDNQELARAILTKAEFIAVGSYTRLAKDFPTVNKIEPKDWDFFATSAAVALAVELAPDEPSLLNALQQQLESWDQNGLRAVLDCVDLMRNSAKGAAKHGEQPTAEIIESALGIWIVRNATSGAPLDDPSLARAAGRFVAAAIREPAGVARTA